MKIIISSIKYRNISLYYREDGPETSTIKICLEHSQLSANNCITKGTLPSCLGTDQLESTKYFNNFPSTLLRRELPSSALHANSSHLSTLVIQQYLANICSAPTPPDLDPSMPLPEINMPSKSLTTFCRDANKQRFPTNTTDPWGHFILFSDKNPPLTAEIHAPGCDKILCRSITKGLSSQPYHGECMNVSILEPDLQKRIAQMQEKEYLHMDHMSLAATQHLYCSTGVTVQVRRVSPPANFIKSPWKTTSLPTLRVGYDIPFNPRDMTASQLKRSALTNKFMSLELLDPSPDDITCTHYGESRLCAISNYPFQCSTSVDAMAYKDAANEEQITLSHGTLTSATQTKCPICAVNPPLKQYLEDYTSNETYHNGPSLIRHLLLYHYEFTIYNASIICPSCFAPLINDLMEEKSSFLFHYETLHTPFETFCQTQTSIGTGERAKMSLMAYAIAIASLRSEFRHANNAMKGNTNTVIPPRKYCMATQSQLTVRDPAAPDHTVELDTSVSMEKQNVPIKTAQDVLTDWTCIPDERRDILSLDLFDNTTDVVTGLDVMGIDLDDQF